MYYSPYKCEQPIYTEALMINYNELAALFIKARLYMHSSWQQSTELAS